MTEQLPFEFYKTEELEPDKIFIYDRRNIKIHTISCIEDYDNGNVRGKVVKTKQYVWIRKND